MKKRILQDTVRHILPKELYNRPKKGFEIPLMKGFKNELKSWIQHEMLEEDFVQEQGVFNPDYIKQVQKTIFESSYYDQNQVWALLAFQFWWKEFMV